MIIVDNHMHIDELNGYGLDAIKKFKRAGGSALFLVNKLTKDVGCSGVSLENFERLFSTTVRLAEKIRALDVKAFPVLGVHPAELHFMIEQAGMDRAMEIAEKALKLASEYIADGKAYALGEVGRPHYTTSREVVEACEQITLYAMELAKDLDCAVQLHTESFNEKKIQELSELIEKVKINPSRVIKHFSPPLIKAFSKSGIMPSLIAKKSNIEEALKEGYHFLMESDYIDDRRRPGAVVGPKAVPRVTLNLLKEGVLTEDTAYKIHVENIQKTYGIEIEE